MVGQKKVDKNKGKIKGKTEKIRKKVKNGTTKKPPMMQKY